jgi:hypothetical protein
MIISSASSNAQFTEIYWKKYMHPRRAAFAVVLERAKARKELGGDLDPGLVFDSMSGIMLYVVRINSAPSVTSICQPRLGSCHLLAPPLLLP